jgi:hypothetical protein
MVDKRLVLGGFLGGIGLGIATLASPSVSGALRDFTEGFLAPPPSSEQGLATVSNSEPYPGVLTEKQLVSANVATEGKPAASPTVGPGPDQDAVPTAPILQTQPSIEELAEVQYRTVMERPHSLFEAQAVTEMLAQIRSQNAASATEPIPSSTPPNSNIAALNLQTTDRAGESTSPASDSAQPADMQNSGDNENFQAFTQREAVGAIEAPLLAAFISLIPVVLVYGAILGQPPMTMARKYAAWASTTAVLAYMAILNDLCLGRFGDDTVGKAIGFGLWAAIFTVSAYLIGKYLQKSSHPQISSQDTPAREQGVTNRPHTGADEEITPDSALLLTQKWEMSEAARGSQIDRKAAAMNHEQRGIVLTDERAEGWPSWIWWAGGLFLLLAYCNYSDRDRRAEPQNATAGMSVGQTIAYRECMASSRGYNISDYAKSDICSKSALGVDTSPNCHTEWDGRGNPTVCD